MGSLAIRDHTIWVKHINDAPQIVRKIMSLEQNTPVALIIENKPVLFRKMRNGKDGRPTDGIRPDEDFKQFWKEMYEARRGETVSIELNSDFAPPDSYLKAVSSLLEEWDSVEDNEAFNDL